jgi:protein translocase SecG subunit
LFHDLKQHVSIFAVENELFNVFKVEKMYTLLIVLALLAAIFMIGIVLIQSSKEGDLIWWFEHNINPLIGKKSFNIVERTTLILLVS